MTPSSRPMINVPTPSHFGSPVASETAMAPKAMRRPARAPRSSSSTTGSSGVFARRTNWGHVFDPFTFRDSTMAVRSEKLSSRIDTPRMA